MLQFEGNCYNYRNNEPILYNKEYCHRNNELILYNKEYCYNYRNKVLILYHFSPYKPSLFIMLIFFFLNMNIAPVFPQKYTVSAQCFSLP